MSGQSKNKDGAHPSPAGQESHSTGVDFSPEEMGSKCLPRPWGKVLAAKADDLSLIRRMVEEDSKPIPESHSLMPYTHAVVCLRAYHTPHTPQT